MDYRRLDHELTQKTCLAGAQDEERRNSYSRLKKRKIEFVFQHGGLS